tara:strand:+ start:76 stop:1821 length:1746 start_codon:yes stop_codon:yes gene_type:complete
MTSIYPVLAKKEYMPKDIFFNSLTAKLEKIILGSEKNYHILAWETDKIPEEYKETIKSFKPEKVITPSSWNTKTVLKFSDSITIPHLIDDTNSEISKLKLPFDPNKNFVALSVSEWDFRKNFESLIQSFILEFGNTKDAYLVIKTNLKPDTTKEDLFRQFSYLKNSITIPEEKKQNIVFILSYLEKEKMRYLYDISDLFCLTSFGEGFSLPTSEAVAAKTPVLCSPVGGHIDYINKENRYFTDGSWDTVIASPPYNPDGNWYIPTINSIRKSLRTAYEDWKSNNGNLEKSAKKNYEILKAGNFSKERVGNLMLKTITNSSVKEKNKTQKLKKQIQNISFQEKINLLKDSYKGKECYILGCGPSINDYDEHKLSKFLENKLVLSVKQAYERFKEVTDFHFFNCSNLPKRENYPFNPPYRYSDKTISISSSNYDEYLRWPHTQISDLFFKIPIRTEINNEFLVRTGKIDDYLLDKQLTRPCGPGIMYETVLFMAIHLGVKSITCIGWDLTNDKVNETTYEHFYGSTENLLNRGDILDWEIEETKNFSKSMFYWLKRNGINLRLASSKSKLYKGIPRIKLEELK